MVDAHDEGAADRDKREHLLAAILDIFPPRSPAAYGTTSPRYHKFVEAGSIDELQPLLTSRMSRVMTEFRKMADDLLKQQGHNIQRWQTLYDLAVNDPGETLTSISNRTGIIGPRLVLLFDELEAEGLIVRAVDDKDRRSKIIQLTKAGDDVVSHLYKVMDEFRQKLFAGITRSELALMLDMTERMRSNLVAVSQEG